MHTNSELLQNDAKSLKSMKIIKLFRTVLLFSFFPLTDLTDQEYLTSGCTKLGKEIFNCTPLITVFLIPVGGIDYDKSCLLVFRVNLDPLQRERTN